MVTIILYLSIELYIYIYIYIIYTLYIYIYVALQLSSVITRFYYYLLIKTAQRKWINNCEIFIKTSQFYIYSRY